MRAFVQRGLENPQQEVTRSGFREMYVKAIVQDDLPFGFGHKGGAQKMFDYILPKGFTTPSASTVKRDLMLLFNAADKQMTQEINVS